MLERHSDVEVSKYAPLSDGEAASVVHAFAPLLHLDHHIASWLHPAFMLRCAAWVAIQWCRLLADERPSSAIIGTVRQEDLEAGVPPGNVHGSDDRRGTEVELQNPRIISVRRPPPMPWVFGPIRRASEDAVPPERGARRHDAQGQVFDLNAAIRRRRCGCGGRCGGSRGRCGRRGR